MSGRVFATIRFDGIALNMQEIFFSDRLIRILAQKRWFTIVQKLRAEAIFGVKHWSANIRKIAFTFTSHYTWRKDPHVTHLYLKYEPRREFAKLFEFFPNLTHFSSEQTQIGLSNHSAQLEHISIKRGQFAGGEFPCLRVLIIPSYKGCIRQILQMPVLEVLVTGICSSKSFVIPQQMTRLAINSFLGTQDPILIKNLSTNLVALQLPVANFERHEDFFKTLKCCPLTTLGTSVSKFNFEYVKLDTLVNLNLSRFQGDLSQLKNCKSLQRLIILQYDGDLGPIAKISTLTELEVGYIDIYQIPNLITLKQLCRFQCRAEMSKHEELITALYLLKQHCPHLK